jgi:hypothetical protein
VSKHPTLESGSLRRFGKTPGPSYPQQRPGATSAHTFCLRSDHAADHIDCDDHYFWIVA